MAHHRPVAKKVVKVPEIIQKAWRLHELTCRLEGKVSKFPNPESYFLFSKLYERKDK